MGNKVSKSDEEKRSTLDMFLNDLLDRELKLKYGTEEVKEINAAVVSTIERISELVCRRDPRLRIGHVIQVGSSKEGTRVINPDEYDFQLELETLSWPGFFSVSSQCPDKPGYVHVQLQYYDLKTQFGHLLDKGFLRCSRADSFFTLREGLRDMFYVAIQQSMCLLNDYSFHVCHKTGKLSIKSPEVEENGPAFKVHFVWKRYFGEQLMDISVDLCPVIRYDRPLFRVLKLENVSCPIYYHHALETGFVMLLPCNKSQTCNKCLCFKTTFTHTELLLMRYISEHHKSCYMILKYLLNGCMTKPSTAFHSYALKTLILDHHYKYVCLETISKAKCVFSILKRLENILTGEEALQSPFNAGHSLFRPKDRDSFLDSRFARLLEDLDKIACLEHYDFDKCKVQCVNSSWRDSLLVMGVSWALAIGMHSLFRLF